MTSSIENMNILYNIMARLHKAGHPFVFKGTLVLRQLIQENTNLMTSRLSKDTDGDWTGEKITSSELLDIINSILGEIEQKGLIAKIIREPTEKRSAGFVICRDEIELFGIDISFKRNDWCVEYKLTDTDSYMGATKNKMYADKMCAVSERSVYRRAKDIYDLFILSHVSGFKISELKDIVREIGREVGEFNQFLNNVSELRKGYDALEGIINKPSFEEAYGRARDFVMPFITSSDVDGLWSVADGVWAELSVSNNIPENDKSYLHERPGNKLSF